MMNKHRDPIDPRSPVLLWGLGVMVAIAAATPAAAQQSATAQQSTVDALIGDALFQIDPQEKYYNFVQQALTRFNNRDYDGARTFLGQAKDDNPELPPGELLLAKLHLAANQAALARTSLERTVREHPGDPEAFLIMADMARRAGRSTEANLLYRHASTATGTFTGNAKRKRSFTARALAGLATGAELSEDWAEAVKLLEQWVKAAPENASAQLRLGRALYKAQKPRESLAALQAAKKTDPSLPYPDVTLARLYQSDDNQSMAQKLVDRAIQRDGQNAETRVAVAQWYVEVSRPEDAKTHLDEALSKDPNSLDALLLRGVVARIEKDFVAAEQHLAKAHLLAPGNLTITNQLALVLLAQDDEESKRRAREFAELNVARNPNNGEAGVTLGWVYYQLGRVREAQQTLNNALQRGGLNADSRYLVAKISADQQRTQQAVDLLESAFELRGLFVHRAEARSLLDQLNKN